MAIQKDKNDNEVWQNAKGFTSLAKLLQKQNEAIEEGNKDSKMTLKELRNSVDKSAQLNKNATDEQKDVVKRMGELQILGYDEASAESMARTGATLTALKEEREQLKDILENNGLNVPQDARIQALDSEIKSFEEIQKFGKTLTSFERGFHMFAGETFEELIKATQEGGKLTAKGITQGLGADLKGDFDKVLGFLGPAVGFLQQIPLLGTILNLGQNLAKRLFVELFLTRKSAKVDSVAQVKATATQTKVLHADAMAERRERRREVRRLKKNRMMDKRSGAIAGKEGKGKKGMNPFLFTAAGMFLTTLSMVAGKLATGLGALGSVIGTGFAAIGAAGPAILKGAAIFAAALVLIGGAVGAGGVMALKGIQKGFEGWDEAGIPELLKKLSDPAINVGKITALIMGLGLASIAASTGGFLQTITTFGGKATPFTALGKDLGGFAENIKGFDKLDAEKIIANTAALAGGNFLTSLSGVFQSIFTLGGRATPYTNMGKDLGGFAEGVKPFMDLNMALFKEQIKRFHEAIAALSNLPKFGYNQKNTMREVLKLSDIQFKQENVGQELQLVGTGVGLISSGIETLTMDKARALGKLGKEIGQNFDNFNLNFGSFAQTAGAGANLNITQQTPQPQAPVIIQPTNIDNRSQTNVRREYIAQNVSGQQKDSGWDWTFWD